MTASVQIINTSNWDGEDVVITTNQGGNIVNTVLKPGDGLDINKSYGNTTSLSADIGFVDNPDSKPFYLNGKQVYPQVTVGFG